MPATSCTLEHRYTMQHNKAVGLLKVYETLLKAQSLYCRSALSSPTPTSRGFSVRTRPLGRRGNQE